MKGLILAGGTSTRMGGSLPKALLPIGPVTMLEKQVRWLHSIGVRDVVASISRHQADSYNGIFPEMDGLSYAVEEKKLGTGGAVKFALEHISDEFVYVMNVDDFILGEHTPERDVKKLKALDKDALMYFSIPQLPYSTLRFG